MKKKILLTCIIVLCASFLITLFIQVTRPSFNYSSVLKNIKYISSDLLKGRLPGSLENKQMEIYIMDQFKNNNLEPFADNYLQSFQTKCPIRINGVPYLFIIDDDGKIIKRYEYSKDFKEDMLNFRNTQILFSKQNTKILSDKFMQIVTDTNNSLFYCTTDNQINFRSSFFESMPFDMYIMLTNEVFNEINNFLDDGYSVNCNIPYSIKEKKLNNVTALIPGINQELSPIVISAHFDHLGTDLKGNVYNGALDNASGISFILELSKYFSEFGKPYRNILFVGFNAEEFGCIGSTEFATKYSDILKDSVVYNFDMIGSDSSVPLYIMGGKNDTQETPLIHSTALTCSREKVPFNYIFANSSDHQSFRNIGIEAITFCDNDLSRIHTPNDTSEFINIKSIERCFNVSSKEIIKSAYLFSPLYIYSKQIMIISLIGIIILVILFIKEKRRK